MNYENGDSAADLGRVTAVPVSWGTAIGDFCLMHLDTAYENPLPEGVSRALGEIAHSAQPLVETMGACLLAVRGLKRAPGRLAAIVK